MSRHEAHVISGPDLLAICTILAPVAFFGGGVFAVTNGVPGSNALFFCAGASTGFACWASVRGAGHEGGGDAE